MSCFKHLFIERHINKLPSGDEKLYTGIGIMFWVSGLQNLRLGGLESNPLRSSQFSFLQIKQFKKPISKDSKGKQSITRRSLLFDIQRYNKKYQSELHFVQRFFLVVANVNSFQTKII